MSIEKGLAIIEVTDTETKGFYIDQDALEFARLNAKTQKRVDEAEKRKNDADRYRSRAEKAKARCIAYNVKTIGHILFWCAVCGGVSLAGGADLVAPIIWIPVGLFALCVACARLGAWIGKGIASWKKH